MIPGGGTDMSTIARGITGPLPLVCMGGPRPGETRIGDPRNGGVRRLSAS